MEIRRTALGENHPDFAASLNNLAWLYQRMGDHAAALRLCREALDVRRSALGESHPDFAASLNDLAMLHEAIGDRDPAIRLYRKALEIRRTTLGENHPDYANSLHGLARLYLAVGDHPAALPLFRRALEIWRATLGENHPYYAIGLSRLAALHQAMGDQAAALPLCRQALEIGRGSLGENHPAYANILTRLALLYSSMGRALGAVPLMEQAAAIDDRMIGQVFAIGSEGQRAACLGTTRLKLHVFLSLALQYLMGSPGVIHAAFELVLRRKAVAAEAVATQRDALLGGRYPALEPQLRDLAALRMQIARKALAGPGPEGLESHQRELAEWNAQRERLESELTLEIPEMNLKQNLRAADRLALAMKLPAAAVLVEFIVFPSVDFQAVPYRGKLRWKRPRYMAFVLRGGAGRGADDRPRRGQSDRSADRGLPGRDHRPRRAEGRPRPSEGAGASFPLGAGRCRLGLTSGSVRPAGSSNRQSHRATDRS